jgi:hypothetical protein
MQFRQDVLQGWMGVVSDVAASESKRMRGTGSTAFGQRPQAPWQYLLDVSLLLSLPSKEAMASNQEPEVIVTFEEGCSAALEQHSTWTAIRQKLHIDDRMDLRLVQEILRRRIDCPF